MNIRQRELRHKNLSLSSRSRSYDARKFCVRCLRLAPGETELLQDPFELLFRTSVGIGSAEQSTRSGCEVSAVSTLPVPTQYLFSKKHVTQAQAAGDKFSDLETVF